MYIADRLRELREYKKLSQGDIEKRTGLLRCYISRVENGHTVPSLLKRWRKCHGPSKCRSINFFYENEESPATKPRFFFAFREKDWASQGKGPPNLCQTVSRPESDVREGSTNTPRSGSSV